MAIVGGCLNSILTEFVHPQDGQAGGAQGLAQPAVSIGKRYRGRWLKSKLKSVWWWFRIDSKGSNLIGVAIQNERRQTETIATLIQFF